MVNLIQPITVQQAYDGITHARWWASWNWWRKAGDDNGDGFPYVEPRMDSRSALPRKIRAWRWLCIVKRDESFSLLFFLPERKYMELEMRLMEVQGAHKDGGRAPTLLARVWAPFGWFFCQYFLLIPKIISVNFQVIPRTSISAKKMTPTQFCWKQRQSWLVPFKSCKLESKTRAKEFGKVDTMETYQVTSDSKFQQVI